MEQVLTTDALCKILNRKSAATIERWLQRNNVRYFLGPDGPFTTIDLLHASVGFVAGQAAEQEHEWKDA